MTGESWNRTSSIEHNYVLNVLNHINDLNDTLFREGLECITASHLENREKLMDGCDVDWDSLLCWPQSPPGTLVEMSCFEQLRGIRYDNTRKSITIK